MSQRTISAYEFGPFKLLPAERLLFHGQEVVPLKPRVFETLLLLIQNRGRVMAKDELMQILWPDTFVEENSLVQNVSLLRRALSTGNSTRQYVETIPKRGYRFVADVRERSGEPEQNTSQPCKEFTDDRPVFLGAELEPADELQQEPRPVVVESILARNVPNEGAKHLNTERLAFALVMLSLLGMIAALITFKRGIWPWSGRHVSATHEETRLTSLTSLGKVLEAAVSPDGRYVAYMASEGGKQGLWIKQIETDTSIRIVLPEVGNCIGLTFSRDGNYIFYTTYLENSNIGSLFQVPVLGGTKRLLVTDIDSPVSLSSDGKQMAFLRRRISSNLVEHTLIIADIDGQNERRLSTRSGPEYYSSHGPAWSPDGKTLVSGVGTIKDVHVAGLVEVNVEDGRERSISTRTWKLVEQITWLPDRSGLIFVAADVETENFMQIWHVSYPAGQVRRVTKDLNRYHGISLSSDSTKLVTVQSDYILSMLVSSDGDAAHAEELDLAAGGRLCGLLGLSTTPDHQIVYSASTGGNTDIWIMNADGTEQKRLTYDEGADFLPSVAPDGKQIVFLSTRSGSQQLWTMAIDGHNQAQLTDGGMKYRPRWSPDGRWIVFAEIRSSEAKATVWRVSARGGEPMQLTKKYSKLPSVSPDGRFIACYYWDDLALKMKVAIIPIDGGEPVKILDTPGARHHWSLQWTPDGRGVFYVQTLPGSATIWRVSLNNEKAQKVLTVPGQIMDFAWSRDGQQFVYTRAISNQDVVSITGFR